MSGLTRKPRVGDRISYDSTRPYTSTVHHVAGNICWVLPDGRTDTRDLTCFIWHFSNPEELNKLHTIVSDGPTPEENHGEHGLGKFDPYCATCRGEAELSKREILREAEHDAVVELPERGEP